ncbi:putative glycosyltransferase [Kurlavirus BKC-1]|nr:putative glycosyltransferase [Kurlavirus BKC-1]
MRRRVSFSSPKILHQTWKSTKLPESCKEFVKTWKTTHADYLYKFYLDEDLREAVKKFVPQHLSLYDAMARNIERVDFARYAILYGLGGAYADLDTVPLKRIDVWMDKGKVVLGREPLEHSRTLYGREVVLCNAFMISPPKEEFWLRLLSFISDNYDPTSDPVSNTGPMAMTLFLEKHPDAFQDVIVTDPCVFFSLTNGFTSKTQLGFTGVSRFCDLQHPTCKDKIPYVVHAWHNEWTKLPGQSALKEALKTFRKKKGKNVVAVAKCGVERGNCLLWVAAAGVVLFVALLVARRK